MSHNVVFEFKSFLTKSNALALAVGVILGAATGKVVTAVVSDLFMPVIGLILPKGDWREARIVLSTTSEPATRVTDAAGNVTEVAGKVSENAIKYGDLIGTTVDFFFIALLVFMITKALVKSGLVPTKECPACKEQIAAGATRCRACTTEFST